MLYLLYIYAKKNMKWKENNINTQRTTSNDQNIIATQTSIFSTHNSHPINLLLLLLPNTTIVTTTIHLCTNAK